MTGRSAAGALLGLAFAVAVVLLTQYAWRWRAPRLADRVGPYVPGLRRELRPDRRRSAAAGSWARWREDHRLARRLSRAGGTIDVSAYRLDQVGWAGAGAGAGGLVGLLFAARGSSPVGVVVLACVGAATGAMLRDWSLGRQVRRRRDAIEAALPTLADLVALAVTSGAGPVAALDRAASVMHGPLADDVLVATAAVRSGSGADVALRSMVGRAGVPALARLVDALLLSVERGSPLADVARAQAADVRAAERRRLLEIAGRKDALMLVPIVFLVLPSVVLVAAFPGLSALRLVVP